MKNNCNICYEGGSGRYEDRKSVFISDVFPVHCEADVLLRLEEVRKKYWDANHHCYAYTFGEFPEQKKFSDDGEPSQTAGKPIMDIIEGGSVHDILIVVTRYFGGTLLGTGGLVRAYQGAAKDGIENSRIIERHDGELLEYCIDYDFYGKLQRFAEKNSINIYSVDFTDKVKIVLAVDKSESLNIINKVEEMSAAKAVLSDRKEKYFIIVDGKVSLL